MRTIRLGLFIRLAHGEPATIGTELLTELDPVAQLLRGFIEEQVLAPLLGPVRDTTLAMAAATVLTWFRTFREVTPNWEQVDLDVVPTHGGRWVRPKRKRS